MFRITAVAVVLAHSNIGKVNDIALHIRIYFITSSIHSKLVLAYITALSGMYELGMK